MIIDYEDLNIEIKNIIGENLNINKNNARDKLRDLYFNRFKKMEKLNFIIDKTGQYQNEFSDVLDFENDIKVFYSATEILINIFNYERDIVLFENKELVKDLIVRNDIQQILKDDIPNLIKINEKIELRENSKADITNIVEAIINLFEIINFEEINKSIFFNMINREVSLFVSDNEIKKLFI